MASFATCIVMGNLGRDPELKHLPSGTTVCEVSLAVNRTWRDKATNERREETSWVPCVLYGRQAEVLAEYCGRGTSVVIHGRITEDRWQDKQTGQQRSKLKVIGENLQMLGRGPDDQTPARADYGHEPQPPAGGEEPQDSSGDAPF